MAQYPEVQHTGATRELPDLPRSIEPPKRNNLRNWSGGLVSVAYLAWATWYGFTTNVMELGPEKVADFLAGIFAPLAFLWLILGFFQQGDELRMSGDALWLQGEELRNSVEQQRQLVETQRDAVAFERERLEEERQELRRKSLPDLVFVGGGWSSTGEVASFPFTLINRGAPCRDLRMDVEHLRVSKALFATGEEIPFKIDLHRTDPKRGIQTYRANYIDAQGLPGSTDLRLVFFEANGRAAVECANAKS